MAMEMAWKAYVTYLVLRKGLHIMVYENVLHILQYSNLQS